MPLLLHAVDLVDDADCWRDAGFAVDADGTCRIGPTAVRLGRPGTPGLVVGPAATAPDDLDGIPLSVTEDPGVDPATHPNGSSAIDHVVVVTPDLDRTTAALEALGVGARRTRDTGTADRPMRQRFFRLGPVIIEVVGPADAAAGPDLGPARVYGLALTSADLDATVAWYRGPEEIGAAKDAVQPGRRIATLRHRTFGVSVPIAFMSPEPR